MDRQRQSDHGMKAVFAFIIIGIVVAGCAGSFGGRPTALSDNLQSACIQSRAAYQSYDNACIIQKGKCPRPQVAEANTLRSQANQYCATGNEAHKTKVLGIVKQLEALGR